MNRGAVIAVMLLSVLCLSACGGDGGSETSSASDWADSFCTDVSTWQSSVSSVVASLQGGDLAPNELQNVVNELAAPTETLVGELQDLGAPDIEAGQEAENAVNQLADELQTGIGEIERAAAAGSGGDDPLQAVSSVSSTLTTMRNELSSTVNGLEQLDTQGELKSAFEESQACSDLTRS